MICYRISEKLEPSGPDSYREAGYQHVMVLGSTEWAEHKDDFDMGIEWDFNAIQSGSVHAEVNFDSITGNLLLPGMDRAQDTQGQFAFSLDEKGIIFIDDGEYAAGMVKNIAANKKLVNPCLERFLYDFLEQLICGDGERLKEYDRKLDGIERQIFDGDTENVQRDIAAIRNDLRDLKIYYQDLIDVCQEFEENENHFFKEENERYFRLVGQRIQRLYERVVNLVEYTTQLRDLDQTKTDEKQNKNIAYLTVISSIFMPLTLIVGWYGMNFKYMPELEYEMAYPILIVICAVLVIVSIAVFKKKKLL